MANVNVNRNVTDAFYRYKMPRLIAKVEGKGNGIKTVIVNMSEIAKALSRPPTYPTKYFGCELGAQTNFDAKNDRYIVNGAHDSTRLQDLLDGFIRKFVLCPECENPETNLIVLPKKNMITQRCIACGYTGNIDMRHKLTTFILKNPPEPDPTIAVVTSSTTTTAATPSGKKGKKSRGKDSAAADNGNGDTGTIENNHEVLTPTKERNDSDDDWGEDTSDAAVKARMEALSGAAKTLTISDDLKKSAQERVDMFYSFVKQRKVAGELTGLEREKEIVVEAERLAIRDKAPLVLAELLYDVNILQQIKQYRTLFCRLTHENMKAQRYLLGAFEQLVGIVHPDTLMPKVPHILKAFYEHDIIDESVIIEWDDKPSRKYTSKEVTKEMAKEIHTKAALFVQWLKEAEEESSEDEEEDGEDVDVEYSHSGPDGLKMVPASKPTVSNGAADEESEGEDVDIDAI
jgi:translation initiation factor 5